MSANRSCSPSATAYGSRAVTSSKSPATHKMRSKGRKKRGSMHVRPHAPISIAICQHGSETGARGEARRSTTATSARAPTRSYADDVALPPPPLAAQLEPAPTNQPARPSRHHGAHARARDLLPRTSETAFSVRARRDEHRAWRRVEMRRYPSCRLHVQTSGQQNGAGTITRDGKDDDEAKKGLGERKDDVALAGLSPYTSSILVKVLAVTV